MVKVLSHEDYTLSKLGAKKNGAHGILSRFERILADKEFPQTTPGQDLDTFTPRRGAYRNKARTPSTRVNFDDVLIAEHVFWTYALACKLACGSPNP